MKKPTTLGTIEFRNRLRERIDAAHANGQHTVITRTDRPLAVLVPVSWYERATGQKVTVTVEQEECFCCTCDPHWDAACRNHGAHGTRACTKHGMPGEACTCCAADPTSEETA